MQNEEKNTKLVNMVVQTQCQVPSNQYNLLHAIATGTQLATILEADLSTISNHH